MSFLHMFSSAITMILLISLLILIHELGHFLAAKYVGIRVDKFGFGLPIGPTLFSKKIGETEILIHAFLLGGYVSFPDDEEECDLPKDSPLRYSNKTVGQRALVISAGVICNVILAYVLIFFTGLIWKHLPQNNFTVMFDSFSPKAVESIKNSGIQKDDIIYSINGTKVEYPIALIKYTTFSKEFDGFASETLIQKKFDELKRLNPNLDSEALLEEGTVVKLPEFTDEEPVKLTFDNIIGIEKYVLKEVALTENQRTLRDNINYQNKYKVSAKVTLLDIASAISDTRKPLSIVVLRDGKEVSLGVEYLINHLCQNIQHQVILPYHLLKQQLTMVF